MKKAVKIVKVCGFVMCGLATVGNCLCMKEQIPLVDTQYLKEQVMNFTCYREREQEITKELAEYAKNEQIQMLKGIESIKTRTDIAKREYQIDCMKKIAKLDYALFIESNIKLERSKEQILDEIAEQKIKIKKEECQKKIEEHRKFLENEKRKKTLENFADTQEEVSKMYYDIKHKVANKIEQEVEQMHKENMGKDPLKHVHKMPYKEANTRYHFNQLYTEIKGTEAKAMEGNTPDPLKKCL